MDKSYWHNFRTGEYEYIETPEDFSDYIPQGSGVSLYKLLVEYKGMKPAAAAIEVLKISAGVKDEVTK